MSGQIKPCRHMEGLLNKHADKKLRGIAKLYAIAHVVRCSKCRQFLEFIEETIAKMRESRDEQAPDEVMKRLADGAWRKETGL